MIRRLFKHALAVALPGLLIGCSSDCAPTEAGGVLVDVTGASDCSKLSVTATDTSGQYALDGGPLSETDGGQVCSFQGLAGHTGTYTVEVSYDGQTISSQTITLERLDSCNVSSRLLKVEVNPV
jgi:hypothetical protein